jgi:hypothetical protein
MSLIRKRGGRSFRDLSTFMQTAIPSAATAQYAVPKRFGMAGILAITTFMAVLFGLLRWCGAEPVVYVFVGLLTLITCLVQMWKGEVPRAASIAAGAIFLPICSIGAAFIAWCVEPRFGVDELGGVICSSPFLLIAGAGAGYLSGACTAGVFLLMDLAEPYLPGGSSTTGPKYARPTKVRATPADSIVMATLVPQTDEDVINALLADNPFAPTRRPPPPPPLQEGAVNPFGEGPPDA